MCLVACLFLLLLGTYLFDFLACLGARPVCTVRSHVGPAFIRTSSLRLGLADRSKILKPEKPKFPVIQPSKITFPNDLVSFVGKRSWLLFNLLKFEESTLDWMTVPIMYWTNMIGYKIVLNIIQNLELVNDCAERAIKLATD